MIDYIYLIILVSWVVLLVGFVIKQKLLVAMMGIVLIYAGLNIITDGLVGNINQLTEVFGLINVIVGSVFFLSYAAEELEKIDI